MPLRNIRLMYINYKSTFIYIFKNNCFVNIVNNIPLVVVSSLRGTVVKAAEQSGQARVTHFL